MAEQQKMKEPGPVLQVERRDYTDLVPTDRPRAHGMRGFDPVYTDIVDYIVRCTHRIWDERDIGLIYSHYTHNAVIYYPLGTIYNREDIVRDTIQRLVTFPERRGMATHVIWNGNDVDGFYTSITSPAQAGTRKTAPMALRPGARSRRGRWPTAWCSRTASTANGSSATAWACSGNLAWTRTRSPRRARPN